ncbi:MAG: LptF/LptG family permease [Candidatus Omnitrophica bacterium]|nr:LptF/LptG family permease [Candidatus Omnitrophota bacterium]
MRILRNYILKDFFSAFTFALLSLTLVMVLGNLVKISDMVIRKGVSLFEAFKLFAFFMPYLLGFTIPLALLLGILISLGRLIADNEIVAIQVAGISPIRILKIFLVIGLGFSLFLFYLNDKILPHFHYQYRSQMKTLSSQKLSMTIEPGVFLDNFENFILYVGDTEENKLKNVYIYETSEDQLSRVTFAKRGEFIVEPHTIKMKLEEGFRDEVSHEDSQEFYRLNFKVFFMDIPLDEEENKKIEKKTSDMTIRELKARIKTFRDTDVVPYELIQEIHKRIGFAFSPLTFVILGFGIATIVRHREKSINFGIAFFTAGIYYLFLLLGETLVEAKMLTPIVGMWLPNIIFVMVGLYLIKNVHRR